MSFEVFHEEGGFFPCKLDCYCRFDTDYIFIANMCANVYVNIFKKYTFKHLKLTKKTFLMPDFLPKH